jgi:hypothetical protein
MIMSKRALLTIVLCPTGFLMCLIGVLLPWHVRNAYLKVIGAIFDLILRLDFFVSFFMDIGFVSKHPSQASRKQI